MKKIFLMLIAACLLISLIACDGKDANDTDTETGTETTVETTVETTENESGISESEWNTMLSAASFENYTFVTEGDMTVTENGEYNSTSHTKSTIKITADKMAILLEAEDNNSSASGSLPMLLEGEEAEANKQQYTQIFMLLLKDYDNFAYDAQTKQYKVAETVVIDDIMKGFMPTDNGVQMFDIPTVIEMRDATVSISEDGKLLKFVCDYTQTMDMGDNNTISTSGITTWTFSDYGTTVIE